MMKRTPMMALTALVLATGCTTQAVDDTLTVSVDLVVPDVDLSCVEDATDVADAETLERQSSFVSVYTAEDDREYCRVYGYYRGPILNFDELRDGLPGGVQDVIWTDVQVQVTGLDVAVDNMAELPQGSNLFLGGLVETTRGIGAFENLPGTPPARDLVNEVIDYQRSGGDGALFSVEMLGGQALSQDVPLSNLVDLVGGLVSLQTGASGSLADTFNAAYESGESDLFVLTGAYLWLDRSSLPEDPSDLTLTVDLRVDYTANAKVNLIGLAGDGAP